MDLRKLAQAFGLACCLGVFSGASAQPRGMGPIQIPGTLQPRDLDGDGEADAFYDTVLKITWLRNADMSGIRFFDDAQSWARGLRIGGYSDWRLPSMVDTGPAGCDWAFAGTDCGYNVQTLGFSRVFSELEYLMRVELGNTGYCQASGQCGQGAWGLLNTGPFYNVRPYFYWTNLSYTGPLGPFAWYYYMPGIYQAYGIKTLGMHAMAVRNGDSGVPTTKVTPRPSDPPVQPAVASVPGQGTWVTSLQPRSLNGDGRIDAYYDPELNVTWLRDVGGNGLQFWADANAWVRTLSAGGYSDWRLPKVVDVNSDGCNFGYSNTDCGYNVRTTVAHRVVLSELGHLFQETLGNKGRCDREGVCDQAGWTQVNIGPFTNLQSMFIWTSVEYLPSTVLAWYYYPYTGYQSFGHKNHMLQVMPLRDGDSGVPVNTVPQPSR
ncbi:hypothetical protein [Ideonella sp. BN130291]|uniref:hypothetical protein n=1 Tax=Ideonella sp. BN130291 TaxID=3112940 RepID=UPI002E26B0C0|nr:hypothetical protein [Ideonella sp. BN130291]